LRPFNKAAINVSIPSLNYNEDSPLMVEMVLDGQYSPEGTDPISAKVRGGAS